ncbi:C2H2 finger domain-containing protein [Ascosphaera apis ARSEF 7405]|uniref:C2H2 finger domain-containing protein n=1 Tax=Ascosphaera apis ARSEF 7405 TaxID=392613 RepID=A0A167X9X8_9EURO|nr:C2H2 finger domain-containing protein [Ascosphaera apis ARSEF 7405]
MAFLSYESAQIGGGTSSDASVPTSYDEQYAGSCLSNDQFLQNQALANPNYPAMDENWNNFGPIDSHANQSQATSNCLPDAATYIANLNIADGNWQSTSIKDVSLRQEAPAQVFVAPPSSSAQPEYSALPQRAAMSDSAARHVYENPPLSTANSHSPTCHAFPVFNHASNSTYHSQGAIMSNNPQIVLSGTDLPCQSQETHELHSLPAVKLSSVEGQSDVSLNTLFNSAEPGWLDAQPPGFHSQAVSNNQYLQPGPWIEDDYRDHKEASRSIASQPIEESYHGHKQSRLLERDSFSDSDRNVLSPRENFGETRRENKNQEIVEWRNGLLLPDKDGSSQRNHRRVKSMNDLTPSQQTQEIHGSGVAPPYLHNVSDFSGSMDDNDDDDDDDDATEIARPSSSQFIALSSHDDTRQLPPTAGNAMQWFEALAQETASLSLAATWGSRRLSDSEVGSLRGTNLASLVAKDQRRREQKHRALMNRDNLMKGFAKLKRRASQTKRKLSTSYRHSSEDQGTQSQSPDEDICARKDSRGSGQNSSEKSEQSNDESTGGGRIAPVIGRVRRLSAHLELRRHSRSSSGLHSLLKKYGGVPAIKYAAAPESQSGGNNNSEYSEHTSAATSALVPSSVQGRDVTPSYGVEQDMKFEHHDRNFIDNDLENESPSFDSAFSPTFDGFKDEILRLNPLIKDLAPFLADQLAYEQVGRLKCLLKLREDHRVLHKEGRCSSRHLCTAQNGYTEQLNDRTGQQDSKVSHGLTRLEATSINYADALPLMVPLPPASQFPATFECGFCFNVLTCSKPSDWTKHVHGDLRPFTCTFDCSEPIKAFKRKADWIRHENELHRHLDWWACDRQDCDHVSYRRDNFQQHLNREHRLSQGHRQKTSKGQNHSVDDQTGYSSREIDQIIDACHHQSSALPQDERCRFCGGTFSEWKELLTHISNHLLRIALPILELLGSNSNATLSKDQLIAHEEMNCAQTTSENAEDEPADNHTVSPDCSGADAWKMALFAATSQPAQSDNLSPYGSPDQPIQRVGSPEMLEQTLNLGWPSLPTASCENNPFANYVNLNGTIQAFDLAGGTSMDLPSHGNGFSQAHHPLPVMLNCDNHGMMDTSIPQTIPLYEDTHSRSPEVDFHANSEVNQNQHDFEVPYDTNNLARN